MSSLEHKSFNLDPLLLDDILWYRNKRIHHKIWIVNAEQRPGVSKPAHFYDHGMFLALQTTVGLSAQTTPKFKTNIPLELEK